MEPSDLIREWCLKESSNTQLGENPHERTTRLHKFILGLGPDIAF